MSEPFNSGALTVANTRGYVQQSSNCLDYYPYTYPNTIVTWPVTVVPQTCAGEIHVFPCPHCDKCKCGAATLKRAKGCKH